MNKIKLLQILIILILLASPFGKSTFNPVDRLDNSQKLAKKDRIELAIQQEFESTVNPHTGKVPSEKLYSIQKEIERQRSTWSRNTDPVSWEERGPYNVGGRTRSILIDQSDPSGNTLFAGSVSGGIWKTTNAKDDQPVWTHVSGLMDNLAIGCLVQDPNDSNILYAGTGEGFFNVDAVKGNGIWKSTNGGQSWTRLSSTANEDFYYTLDMTFSPGGDLFACTRNNGVMRSVNGGQTWTKVLGEELWASTDRAASMVIMSDGTLFVGMGLFETDGIYRSTNNGNNWTKLSSGLPSNGYQRIEIAASASNNNILYALFQDGNSGSCSGLYKTVNKGNNWTNMSLPNAYGMSNFARNQAWYNLAIAVDPANFNRVIVGGIDLHKSENGGGSWTQISQWAGLNNIPYVHADQHVVVFEAGGSGVAFFGNDGGIARASDIGTSNPNLQTINTGYNVTQFYGAAIHPEGTVPKILAGAQDNGTQLFEDPGLNATTEVAGGDGSICHIDPDDPNIQIATYVFNNYYVSTDGGLNFTLKSFNNHGRFANPSVYDNSSQKLYASNWAGSYFRWENPAQSGSATSAVTVSAFNEAMVTSVTLSPTMENRAYFGLDNGDVVKVDNIHTGSSKQGTIVLNGTVGSVSCIAIDTQDEEHMLVTYSNYGIESIKETRNGGQSWMDVEGNLPDIPVRWLVFDPEDANKALIATELGVWRTEKLEGNSTQWFNEDNALSNVRIDQLIFRENDNYLAAATHGRGLFTSTSYVHTKINFDQTSMTMVEQPGSGYFGACELDYKVINVPVSISAAPASTTTVTISVMNGSTAEQGEDFILNTPSLSFTPWGSLQKQVQLKILDEAIEEGKETIELRINGNSNLIGPNNTTTIHLFDDDNDPATGGSNAVTVGNGSGTSSFEYPLGGYYEDGRSQFIYRADELMTAGLTAGELRQLSLYIMEKNSDIPFSSFTIKIKETELGQFGTSGSVFGNGFTTVFSGNIQTQTGWNDFIFDQGFNWDGLSNLLIDICFNNQNWSDDDVVRTTATSFTSVQFSAMDGVSGCTIYSANQVSNQRPDVQFVAKATLQLADELCAKTTTMIQGERAHFYHDGKLMASVENLDGSNINCMELSIDRVGDGIKYPNWMEGAGVTEKTFYIEADIEAPYEVSLYYHPGELVDWPDPTTLNMIKTSGSVSTSEGEDYQVLTHEELEIEILENGIYVFRGVFESFSGFALTDLVPSTLSVDWMNFLVEQKEDLNLISWELVSPLENSTIDLQRSLGNLNAFELIARFDKTDELRFLVEDPELYQGNTYYRLQFTDLEGRKENTPIKSVWRETSVHDIDLYPNPAGNHTFLKFQPQKDIQSIDIHTLGGDSFTEIVFRMEKQGKAEIPLTFLSPGIYLVEIYFDNGDRTVKRLVKQ